jgi:hypothetical protein
MMQDLLERFQEHNFRLRFHNRYLEAIGLPVRSSSVGEGLYRLFCRDWLIRVWTSQETVLPTYVEILCGRHFTSLFDLTRLVACIFNASQSGNFESSTDPIDPKKGYALKRHGKAYDDLALKGLAS